MDDVFTDKIEAIKQDISRTDEGIKESAQDILEKQKEIERLTAIEERFKKIHMIKHYENIGKTDEIAKLANNVRVMDFLNSLKDVMNVDFQWSISIQPIAQLSLWQGMYLFYGDIESLGKTEAPAAEEQKEK